MSCVATGRRGARHSSHVASCPSRRDCVFNSRSLSLSKCILCPPCAELREGARQPVSRNGQHARRRQRPLRGRQARDSRSTRNQTLSLGRRSSTLLCGPAPDLIFTISLSSSFPTTGHRHATPIGAAHVNVHAGAHRGGTLLEGRRSLVWRKCLVA